MTCEQIAMLLPDYLHGQLAVGEKTEIAQHINDCTACAAQVQTWQQLGELKAESPSPVLKRRFDAMLSAYQEGRWEHDQYGKRPTASAWFAWLRAPIPQFALAAVLVLVGIAIGRYESKPANATQSADIASLHRELSSMKQLVVMSMLQQQSPSDRLQGISRTYELVQPDPEIVAALVRSLKFDASVEVRLAALDSLLRYKSNEQVRRGLVEALTQKQSPLVQIALIDALVDMRESNAVPAIKQFQQTPGVNPAVRERAQWGVTKLVKG